MKLFFAPGACSLSPHIALREAGLAFDLQKVDTTTKEMEGGGDYWVVNGKGYVPTLQLDNGEFLTEGPAIVQYIADLKPDSGLAPKSGTMERTRLQEWLNFLTSEIHKTFSPLFAADTPAEYKEIAKRKLAKRFDWTAKRLEGKAFLMGDKFSVADGYLFVLLNWTKFTGIDLAQWPVLKEYQGRIASRPHVRAAMKAEGLIEK